MHDIILIIFNIVYLLNVVELGYYSGSKLGHILACQILI